MIKIGMVGLGGMGAGNHAPATRTPRGPSTWRTLRWA